MAPLLAAGADVHRADASGLTRELEDALATAAETAATKDAASVAERVGQLRSIVAVLSARPERAQSVSTSRSVPETEATEPSHATQQIDDDDDDKPNDSQRAAAFSLTTSSARGRCRRMSMMW
jgi:hypothetical protein